MLQRDILSGLAQSIAEARDASVERAPVVPVVLVAPTKKEKCCQDKKPCNTHFVMKAHMGANLKGLEKLDSKLAKGGVLSGLGPPR